MPRKKKRRSSKKKQHRRSILFNKWTFQLLIILGCVFTAYFFWLDYQVRDKFEGNRWLLPARVYASPYELYSGKVINKSTLKNQLDTLGYRNLTHLSGPGQYKLTNQTISLVNREFIYWDGKERSQYVIIQFENNSIGHIRDKNTNETIPYLRIEPEIIGKIYPSHNEDRILVSLKEVPDELTDALIAVEDRNYYIHYGVDPKGLLRSLYINLKKGKIAQGGSTLTQQLVKNFYLSHERTIWRKFNEMLMAFSLEWHYSKAEILHAYINEIYLGQHGSRAIHGFGTAAEYYFSKPLHELQISQLALLVGMVKGASYYNPHKHPDRAMKRRNLVLNLMHEQAFISETQLKRESAHKLNLAKKPRWTHSKYPAYLDLVRRHLKRDYHSEDLKNEGLRIFTTLDTSIQNQMETSVHRHINRFSKQKRVSDLTAAGVLLNYSTGDVLAMVGGHTNNSGTFNRALDAKRPIGSLVKPAIYLNALSKRKKYTLVSLLDDSPIKLQQPGDKIWEPKNYDGTTHGQVLLIDALAKSYNLATVNLGMSVGLNNVIKTIHQMGIEAALPDYPSIFLGAIDLSPYDVARLYQVIANSGFQVPPRAIYSVLDKDGLPLRRYDLKIKQVFEPEAVFLLQYALQEVIKTGTGRSLIKKIPELMPMAGKTGTTNKLRDSWFAGFGGQYLSVVWVGRDNNQPTGLTGSSGAMQIWADIMKSIKPAPLTLNATENIIWRYLKQDNTPDINCASMRRLPFIKDAVPANVVSCD